jgi:hypothetical protein
MLVRRRASTFDGFLGMAADRAVQADDVGLVLQAAVCWTRRNSKSM